MALNPIKSLRKNGIKNSFGWAWHHFCEYYYERRLGIFTGRNVISTTAPGQDCKHYEPLHYYLIRNVFAALGDIKEDHFLDYGSGLGRVVFMAGFYKCRAATGIDIDPALIAASLINFGAANSSIDNKTDMQFVAADATSWQVPDDVTIIFMFNPFVGKVMDETQRRIKESLDRHPRKIRIIYAHAFDQADLFAKCPWLKHSGNVPTGVMHGMKIEMYETRFIKITKNG